jgi:DNA polymerase III subunit gamma/tau
MMARWPPALTPRSTDTLGSMAAPDSPLTPYLVLARKYRPQSFANLIGQDAMVQTLANAFKASRIPHAFILTGIRGVGKTTTARILARAVNYEDEAGRRPTLELEREGTHCRAIIEGRHVDVVEMDAASNTGIGDIREIIDSVKYGPVSAPFKVYIIDEVHMLSTAAFNGLLKTLEEPPPYVKFIFATTEIRKVPVTILSRCMRFDLRRVPAEVMTAHLEDILAREGVPYERDALGMIVRAGEGSVRDNQSLLDQAISHGDGRVTAETVKAMLGLGDRARIIDLFEALMAGRIGEGLEQFAELYALGADPETTLADLLQLTHLVTRGCRRSGADPRRANPRRRPRTAAWHAGADPHLAGAAQGARGGEGGRQRAAGGRDGAGAAGARGGTAQPGRTDWPAAERAAGQRPDAAAAAGATPRGAAADRRLRLRRARAAARTGAAVAVAAGPCQPALLSRACGARGREAGPAA